MTTCTIGTRLERSAARLKDWLSLAAAPTFATMALMSTFNTGSSDMLCSAAHASPFGGMIAMYLLMSLFHLSPWLRFLARRPSARPS
jgi:hypothetical protein